MSYFTAGSNIRIDYTSLPLAVRKLRFVGGGLSHPACIEGLGNTRGEGSKVGENLAMLLMHSFCVVHLSLVEACAKAKYIGSSYLCHNDHEFHRNSIQGMLDSTTLVPLILHRNHRGQYLERAELPTAPRCPTGRMCCTSQ